MNAIDIPRTLAVVVESWNLAEREVRENVATYAPELNEDEITSRFHQLFARILAEASRTLRIETAFLQDLRLATRYESFDESELRNIARGLVAVATLHPGETETRPGGDLGLVIVRPKITSGCGDLTVRGRHRRGLLCQAKLRRYGRRWPTLTTNQERVLLDRTPYVALLLLYLYLDRSARNLRAFNWQVCSGYSVGDIKWWVRNSSFPEPSVSEEILRAADTIGTSDEGILDTIIAPGIGRYLARH